ncbi:MAG TPA: CoA transferase, partial [Candidatus Binataceae bacterium]|nr:CoA transferase [Candidatus Binataceae bacterium]
GRYPREQAYNPLWNHYKCADGQWIAFAMLQADRYWKDFCTVLGLSELADDPRFADIRARGQNAAALVEILDRTFAARPRAEWLAILRDGGDFIYTIVNSISDLPHDPQVLTNRYIVDYEHPAFGATQLVGLPVILSQTPGDPCGYAPELGQHSESILTEMLGYSWDDIAELRREGVL